MSLKVCHLSQSERHELESRNKRPNCENHCHYGTVFAVSKIASGEFYFVDNDFNLKCMAAVPNYDWRIANQTAKGGGSTGPGMPCWQRVEVRPNL